ncbi:hypothetical protein [Leptospira vanthielii]|uniref:Uncharacterized protein n=1 Tax=Leptospira vanthielii serovar Holland str. Waz Holland = ATCC 700522 TaxID=1218591 RepID=N1WE40_9LEPT|nr:hypothetical protein [Leptospira vanthielii]EMY70156.1 hypothetical protein LEP1GSC199_1217 [Leptospira vanthielii serovar Holland str. Waz Holland = ATCC 700522]
MKRKFAIGFILIFLAYLGCKSSVFGFCTSAEKFVERASIPPCHQSAESKGNAADSCECPITHEELQSSTAADFPIWKQVKLVVWDAFTDLEPKLLHRKSKLGLLSQLRYPTPYFPTQTVRLLI